MVLLQWKHEFATITCSGLPGKKKKNYVGSETLPASIKEGGPHWCTDRMTHPPRSLPGYFNCYSYRQLAETLRNIRVWKARRGGQDG
eukprot:477761-Pelagomonas_calceolata.AAC.4